MVSAAACKASGGSWMGGHDISGHVFLLVLGSFFLVQEVGWVVARWARWVGEERCVVMPDGAVKGAGVEAADRRGDGYGHGDGAAVPVLDALGLGGKFAAGVVALCGWMLLMTAIYFHTWLEKVRLYDACALPRTTTAMTIMTMLTFTAHGAAGGAGGPVHHLHPPALGARAAQYHRTAGHLNRTEQKGLDGEETGQTGMDGIATRIID